MSVKNDNLADIIKSVKESTETDGIRLTAAAAKQVQSICSDLEQSEDMYLFVGVKGGGCSGLQWILDLRSLKDNPLLGQDEFFVSQGILIVSDFKSYVVGNLSGTEVDYVESFEKSGFVFNNPNLRNKCGCGSSFT